jgi:NAD(P)-dependent dehydrogenase (short-subunit alcohol dehydrogenase family)
VTKVAAFSQAYGVDLRTVELDVLSQDSVDAAVAKVIVDTGRIDVLVHNQSRNRRTSGRARRGSAAARPPAARIRAAVASADGRSMVESVR